MFFEFFLSENVLQNKISLSKKSFLTLTQLASGGCCCRCSLGLTSNDKCSDRIQLPIGASRNICLDSKFSNFQPSWALLLELSCRKAFKLVLRTLFIFLQKARFVYAFHAHFINTIFMPKLCYLVNVSLLKYTFSLCRGNVKNASPVQ